MPTRDRQSNTCFILRDIRNRDRVKAAYLHGRHPQVQQHTIRPVRDAPLLDKAADVVIQAPECHP